MFNLYRCLLKFTILPLLFKSLLILKTFFFLPFFVFNSNSQVFTLNNYEFFLSDNAGIGSSVGQVAAYDEEENTFTYSIITGNTNNAFEINENSGEIFVAKNLNFHTQKSYQLTIRAVKEAGGTEDLTVDIKIYPGTVAPSFNTITWSNAANLPYKVSEAQGKSVNDKLYSFGGFDINKIPDYWTPTKRAHEYDPATNIWSAIADLPYTPKGTDFGGITHAGITTDGTDIYFAGGYTSNSDGTGQIFGTNQVWKYNVASNTYTSLPDLPLAISTGQMEYLNGRLHYIGGTNVARNQDLGHHYVLDLDNPAAGWKTLAALPNPRQHAGSAVFDGKIYFIGGQKGHDEHLVTQKDVHVYHPASDSWEKLADLPVPAGTTGRGHITSTVVVMGERIIVLGGETAHNQRTNFVSAYTPSTNSWSNLTPLPVSIATGIASVLQGALYYSGGDFRNSNFKGTYEGINSQPVVNIINPQPQESFDLSAPILIEVDATISSGTISKVEFYAGESKLGEDNSVPYSFSWNITDPGHYNIIAKAIDNQGAITSSSAVYIRVHEANIPPIVQITSPANGTKFLVGTEIIITAEASDEDGSVQRVEFYHENTKIGEDTSPPYQFSWIDVPAGIFDLKARAFDNLGASIFSTVATIEVLVEDSPPVISIISPEAGSEFEEGEDILIEIETLDPDNLISSIEIFQNNTRLIEFNNPPYSFTWENVMEGLYEITAIAHTTGGEEILSEVIEITVAPGLLTGIDKKISNSSFKIYPVPSSGNVFIEFQLNSQLEEFSLDIYDLQGKIIYKKFRGKAEADKIYKFEIEGHTLPSGIYLAKLRSGNTYSLQKFILNK